MYISPATSRAGSPAARALRRPEKNARNGDRRPNSQTAAVISATSAGNASRA